MGSTVRQFTFLKVHNARVGLVVPILLSAAMAGCSSDVSRFDFPAFGLTTSTTPVPSEPVAAVPPSTTYGGGYGAPSSEGGYAYRGPTVFDDNDPAPATGYDTYQGGPYSGTARRAQSNVEVARLPDVASDQTAYGGTGGYDASPSTGGYQMSDDGRAVIVRPGDSLYKIARDYNVSMSELMRVNHMSSPSVRLGQRITLPSAGSKRMAKSLYKTKPVLETRAPKEYSLAGDGGTYKVESGDSLYGIARRFNVKADDLAEANGIDDPAKLRPGQMLRIPGGAGGASYADDDAAKPKKRLAAVRETVTDDSDSGADYADPGSDSEFDHRALSLGRWLGRGSGHDRRGHRPGRGGGR